MRSLRPEAKPIVDVRYAVTYQANGASAVNAALTTTGLSRVLVSGIFYCDPHDSSHDGFYFAPTFVPEYRIYTKHRMDKVMEISEEFERRKMPSLDIPFTVTELLSSNKIEELWIYLNQTPIQLERAVKNIVASLYRDSRIIFLTPHSFPKEAAPSYSFCDPTGSGKYVFSDGSLSGYLRHFRDRARLFAFGSRSWATHVTTTLL